MSKAVGEEKNAEFETLSFRGVSNVVIPEDFPPKPKDPGRSSAPHMVGQVRIDRALCDLVASVSLIPYPIF